MKALFKILILITGLCWYQVGTGQTGVNTRLDTNAILIGDQVDLEISFTCPADYAVFWPVLRDTLAGNIEIIKHSEAGETLSSNQYDKLYTQTFTLTSFDSGYHVIPPIRIEYKTPGDTSLQFAESEALLLQVNTVPVNLEEEIKDIKDPLGAPFTFREALPYILGVLGAALIGFLVYFFILKRKKAEPVFKVAAARSIPAQQAALEALESLRYKKLWQNGEIKQYHTELTDIVREYLWAKLHIHAPEFTTEEIMVSLNGTGVNFQAKEKLHQTLVLADLVKFAKMQPLPLEHDASLNNAIDFVRETAHLTDDGSLPAQEDQPETLAVSDTIQQPTAAEPEPGKEVKDV